MTIKLRYVTGTIRRWETYNRMCSQDFDLENSHENDDSELPFEHGWMGTFQVAHLTVLATMHHSSHVTQYL